MIEESKLPPIRVANVASTCPFCKAGLNAQTLYERERCIEYCRSQHVATFDCGTVWFMPDEKGMFAFSRHCGDPSTHTFYGKKKDADESKQEAQG